MNKVVAQPFSARNLLAAVTGGQVCNVSDSSQKGRVVEQSFAVADGEGVLVAERRRPGSPDCFRRARLA